MRKIPNLVLILIAAGVVSTVCLAKDKLMARIGFEF
jgi:hypothetical protein